MIKRSCQCSFVGLGLIVSLLAFSSCNKIKISEVTADTGNSTSSESAMDIPNSMPVINTRECSGHVEEAGVISSKARLQARNIKIAIIEVPAKLSLRAKDQAPLIQAIKAANSITFNVRETGKFKDGQAEHSDLHNPVFNLRGVSDELLKTRLAALKKGDELKLVMFGENSDSELLVVGQGSVAKKAADKTNPERIVARMTTNLVSESVKSVKKKTSAWFVKLHVKNALIL